MRMLPFVAAPTRTSQEPGYGGRPSRGAGADAAVASRGLPSFTLLRMTTHTYVALEAYMLSYEV